jgi:Flp pilus assembly protein TadG
MKPSQLLVVRRSRARERSRGQIIVIAALGILAIVAMIALVLEGGNAYAQQRVAQNGSDSAANAGAVALAQRLGGATITDLNVSNAVNRMANQNTLTAHEAYYTNIDGQLLDNGGAIVANKTAAAKVGDGVIPPGAQGVFVGGTRTFGTFFGNAIGISSLSAAADATAVTGLLTGGAFLPVVFPVNITDCSQSGNTGIGVDNWPLSQPGNPPVGQEYIVPLCKTNAGSFQILDLDPSLSCIEEVETPPTVSLPLPTDVPTDNGNNCANLIVDYVNTNLKGKVVLIPICDVACAGGQGSGGVYHVIKVTAFYIDYMSDSNLQNQPNSDCQAHNGLVPIYGNGSSSCLAGWFVRYTTTGPVTSGAVGNADSVGVQLIK